MLPPHGDQITQVRTKSQEEAAEPPCVNSPRRRNHPSSVQPARPGQLNFLLRVNFVYRMSIQNLNTFGEYIIIRFQHTRRISPFPAWPAECRDLEKFQDGRQLKLPCRPVRTAVAESTMPTWTWTLGSGAFPFASAISVRFFVFRPRHKGAATSFRQGFCNLVFFFARKQRMETIEFVIQCQFDW